MTAVRRFLFMLIPLTLSPAIGIAQAVPAVISHHYTTAEGLPSNNVMCALKDHHGFLWFGTWYGLCRFDGREFMTYNKPVRPSSDIPPRKVESIAADGQGRLWLKTVDWKLYTFDPRTECFRGVQDDLKLYTKNLQVIKIQPTADGHVLLLTKDKNLLLATTSQEGRPKILRLFDARSYIHPQTLQLERDIIATAKGYSFFIGRDYRLFLMRASTISDVRAAMSKEDNIMHATTLRHTEMAEQAGIGKYATFYQDRDSLLWVTTPSEGIYCISKPKRLFSLIPLPDNDQTGVRCIYQTRQGSIIVSSRSRNVYIYGLDGQLRQTLDYAHYGIGAVYDATEDSQGRLWLSTKGDGLVVVNPSSPITQHPTPITHYRHDPADPASLSGNNVYMTRIDSKGHIWVGTLDGGLNLVSEQPDGRLTFYNKDNGFRQYPAYGLYTEVRNIVEDKQGRIWVGTIDGLMSFKNDFKRPEDIAFYTSHNTKGASFANNDIYTLHCDHQGQVWVGAFGGGLQKIIMDENSHTPSFQPLGPREGLRNDVIYSITEDLHGRLWLATEAGISCYDQQTQRVRSFDRYEGLPDIQMEEMSATCCSDGQLWIGSKQGILTFHPEQMPTGNANYRTCIIELNYDNHSYVGDEALPYAQEIELEYDNNSFTIEFAALDYQNHGNINYRYRLEGFDRDWRYSGIHRVGSYNEVPPGKYTFVVETIDDANPLLHSKATMTICILPPWWATWWAYAIYLCLAALVAWIIVRTILQFNRMRNEIYISQRLAKLTSKPDEGDEFIDRLHRIIRENIANSDFNIDAIASEMGLSRSAFYKKVKGQTGFAPVDLIKEFRLSHAAELLQTTTLSITEVAYRSGFKDASYFGKCFRKRYGITPREYIKTES